MDTNHMQNIIGAIEKIDRQLEMINNSPYLLPLRELLVQIFVIETTGAKDNFIKDVTSGFNDKDGIPIFIDNFNLASKSFDIYKNIRGRFSKEISGRFFVQLGSPIELNVTINNDTGVEDLEDGWYKIREIREFINQIQGTNAYSQIERIKLGYLVLKNRGMTESKLATIVNTDFYINLCLSVIYENQKSNRDWIYAKWYLARAAEYLKAMSIKDGKIKMEIDYSLEEIKKYGRKPIKDSYPVDQKRFHNTMKYWQKKVKNNKWEAISELEEDFPVDLENKFRNTPIWQKLKTFL